MSSKQTSKEAQDAFEILQDLGLNCDQAMEIMRYAIDHSSDEFEEFFSAELGGTSDKAYALARMGRV